MAQKLNSFLMFVNNFFFIFYFFNLELKGVKKKIINIKENENKAKKPEIL